MEFSYRPEVGAVVSGSASIGLAAGSTGSGNYLSLQDTGVLPGVSSLSEFSDLASPPASGQVYTFTPPAVVPASPTGLNFTAVTETSMTV